MDNILIALTVVMFTLMGFMVGVDIGQEAEKAGKFKIASGISVILVGIIILAAFIYCMMNITISKVEIAEGILVVFGSLWLIVTGIKRTGIIRK